LFTIVRRMPNDPSGERVYRIKSDLEFCERNVLESALDGHAQPMMGNKTQPIFR
jgi:hypothetical protein